ncbi:hypothetical protein FG91_03376 [Sphingopyxis sp. LC81]|nr:hypothetical protein FG91_03376 [Sphingopyxis sp. LC81]
MPDASKNAFDEMAFGGEGQSWVFAAWLAPGTHRCPRSKKCHSA